MSKYTRNAIIKSFLEQLKKKSLDKVTVKDIIESAGINRNTFYYHFQDIYDLLEKTFEDASVRFRDETPPNSTFYQEYARVAQSFNENKEAILHIYNSKSRDVLNRYLEASSIHFVSKYVRKASEGTYISQNGIDYITHFYSYAIVGATMHWIEKKMPGYKDELIGTVAESFDATIEIMIKTYIAGHVEECC